MANDDLDMEDVPVEKKGSGKSGMFIIILLAVNMLLVLGLGAYFFLFLKSDLQSAMQGGGETAENAAEGSDGEKQSEKTDQPGPIAELDPFLVNLDEPGSNRYLKAMIKIEMDGPAAEAEVKVKSVQLRDLVLTYLSSLNYSQTQGVVNKDIIRTTLIKQINKQLNSGKVRRLYFTEFVIQ